MSEPEIARRCQNCGASVRGRAYFCPQCGRPMVEGAERGEAPAQSRESGAAGAAAGRPLAEEAERVAASLSGKLGDAPAVATDVPLDNHATRDEGDGGAARHSAAATGETLRSAGATADAPAAAAPEAVDARAGIGAARGAEPRGGVRGRAAAVGASVGETLKPRVERLREASSVVMDEAAEDPGVRFLVIAAVLFLLFLLLWLLSFTLG